MGKEGDQFPRTCQLDHRPINQLLVVSEMIGTMESKSVVLTVTLVVVLVGAAAEDDKAIIHQTLDGGCKSHCGNVSIPYPFGVGTSSSTGKECFLQKRFNLTCNNNDTLLWGDLQVIAIDITQSKVEMMFFISEVCYASVNGTNKTNGNNARLSTNYPGLSISSEDNKFVSVGCDTFGYLNSYYDDGVYSTGCLTRCYGNSTKIVDERKCSGIGCCQVDVPIGMRNISVRAFSFENFNSSLEFNNCSYSFVVKNGNYTFSKDHLQNLPFSMAPVVFDWSLNSCEACNVSGATTCVDTSGFGYHRCQCMQGYEGNPYHPLGCTDIDECKTGNHTCDSDSNCVNTPGSHHCQCPKKGLSGEGTKEKPCHQENALSKYLIGASVGFVALSVAISSLFLMYQKRKLIKLKEKFFRQNGGIMLQQRLSTREESTQTAQIFTSSELKKATNNYDENLIIGTGGYGTVFKGSLAHNRIVAIKKSKIVDSSQIEQFINEVVVLSQINHRNVVKLLGCCLETEVPLLVYEFVNNGTLFDFIHNGSKVNSSTWKTRLRIAAEAAGALSYLHAAASIPIIHRDVKSANILLDETHTAKVSDFGASRLVLLDQTELATMVQGTIGYLDPEYMQTSQLTEKSDVYSFGVVLVELLTGEKPLSFDRSEDKRSLAIYFLSCLKEDRLLDVLQADILDEENEQEIKEVAILAAKCLRLKGEERPSMKEVAMELEGIRLMQKQLLINADKNLEEMQSLLPRSSSKIYEYGDSSSHKNIGYDSIIRDQELIAFDYGR